MVVDNRGARPSARSWYLNQSDCQKNETGLRDIGTPGHQARLLIKIYQIIYFCNLYIDFKD